jgi:hypothetical protein
MMRTVLSVSLFLVVSVESVGAQVVIGFDFDLDQGTVIAGPAGSTIQVSGHATISASESGVGGWACGFETRSPDGLEFCLNSRIERTTQVDKELLLSSQGQTASLRFGGFPCPTTFIIQDSGDPIVACEGSQDASSTPTSLQNGGRRG